MGRDQKQEHGMPVTAIHQPRRLNDSRERLLEIIKTKSWLRGSDFKLSSGRSSGYFFDMKKTMFDPEGINLISRVVYDTIKDDRDVTAVGGLEIGAIPIVLGVCMWSQNERPIQGFFVRKVPKGHGTNKRIDGNLDPGSTVILFDDVMTTGDSAMKAVDAVLAVGCKIKKVVTVVDRLEGAQENFARHGIKLEAIFTRDNFVD